MYIYNQMKKLIFLSLMLICAFTVSAQSNYSSPGIPSGTTSTTISARIKPATPDSLAQIWLGIGGNKFYRMATGMDDIVFSAINFKGAGTTSDKLDLNDNVVITGTMTAKSGMLIGGVTDTTGHSFSENRLINGVLVREGFGSTKFQGGGAVMATFYGTSQSHALAVPALMSTPFFSSDSSRTWHRIPVIDNYVGATLDTVTHTLTVTGGGSSDTTLYKLDGFLRSDRTVNQNGHSLQFLAPNGADGSQLYIDSVGGFLAQNIDGTGQTASISGNEGSVIGLASDVSNNISQLQLAPNLVGINVDSLGTRVYSLKINPTVGGLKINYIHAADSTGFHVGPLSNGIVVNDAIYGHGLVAGAGVDTAKMTGKVYVTAEKVAGMIGGGGGHNIYNWSDSLINDRTVSLETHSLNFSGHGTADSLTMILNHGGLFADSYNKNTHFESYYDLEPGFNNLHSRDSTGNNADVFVVANPASTSYALAELQALQVSTSNSMKFVLSTPGNGTRGILAYNTIDSAGIRYSSHIDYTHADSLTLMPKQWIEANFSPIGGSAHNIYNTSDSLTNNRQLKSHDYALNFLFGDSTQTSHSNQFHLDKDGFYTYTTGFPTSAQSTVQIGQDSTGVAINSFLGASASGGVVQQYMLNVGEDHTGSGYFHNSSYFAREYTGGSAQGLYLIPTRLTPIIADTKQHRGITADSLTIRPLLLQAWDYVPKKYVDSVASASGATGANPTASIGFTAVNGSAGTFIRSNGAPKADSTVIRSVVNSYSLAGMQTKLNNYALTSSLPTAANPTATAGTSAVNGSATTFMRSDGAPKVDSAVFRTVANSKTLAQEQTALNLKANLASPTFTGTVTVGSLGGYIKGTAGALSAVSTIPYSDITGGPATLTAGRGILLPSTAIILDTTQNYTWSKLQTINIAGVGTATTQGFILNNPTAATSGNQKYSPVFTQGGFSWNTTSSASQPVTNNWQVQTVQGSVASANLVGWFNVNGTPSANWISVNSFSGTPTFGAVVASSNLTVNGTGIFAQYLRSVGAGITQSLAINTSFAAAGIGLDIDLGTTATNTSGTYTAAAIYPNINQASGSGNYRGLWIPAFEQAIGSGTHLLIDAGTTTATGGGGSYTSKFSVDNTGKINSQALTASKVVFTDVSKNLTSTGIGTSSQLIAGDGSLVSSPIIQGTGDLTAQTSAGNIATFTVGASTTTFNISAYLNVTAISTDIIQIQVTYTDENNTAQTVSYTTLNSVSDSNYNPVTIRAKNGTLITVKTNLTLGGGSVTFDAGARITSF